MFCCRDSRKDSHTSRFILCFQGRRRRSTLEVDSKICFWSVLYSVPQCYGRNKLYYPYRFFFWQNASQLLPHLSITILYVHTYACRTEMITDFGSLLCKLLVSLSCFSLNLLTWNCRFISFTVSLATLSERPARFSAGGRVRQRSHYLLQGSSSDIHWHALQRHPPFLPCLFPPLIRTYIITVSMAMLLVGLLTGHFEIQLLSIMKKKRIPLLFAVGGKMRVNM